MKSVTQIPNRSIGTFGIQSVTKEATVTSLTSAKLPTRQKVLLISSTVTLRTSTSYSHHYNHRTANLLTLAPSASNCQRIRRVPTLKKESKKQISWPWWHPAEVTTWIRSRAPLCDIFNCSITEGVVPDLWKRAITVPIPKTNPPNSLDDLRPISLTPIPCKILERIIAKELWKIFAPKLDHRQFGNTKGSSTVHYLVDLTN